MGHLRRGTSEGQILSVGPNGLPALSGENLTGLKQSGETMLYLAGDQAGLLAGTVILLATQVPAATFTINAGVITLPANKFYVLEAHIGCAVGAAGWYYWNGAVGLYGATLFPELTISGGYSSAVIGVVPVSVNPTNVDLRVSSKLAASLAIQSEYTYARIRSYEL